MKIRKLAPMIAALLALVWSSAFADPTTSAPQAPTECDDPLPEIHVVSPASTVAPEIAKFSGIWSGKWGGSLCSSLVVETIDADGHAKVIYSWGDGQSFGPGFEVYSGHIVGNALTFGRGAKFTFLTTDKGDLLGRREFGNRHDEVTMVRTAQRAPAPIAGPVPMLPIKFSGFWSATISEFFRQVGGRVDFKLTEQDASGLVRGVANFWVANEFPGRCGNALNMPLIGQWDGERLRMTAYGSSKCGNQRYDLVRGKDHYFEQKRPNSTFYVYFDPD